MKIVTGDVVFGGASLATTGTLSWNNTTKEIKFNGGRIWTDHDTNGKDNTLFGYNAGNLSITGIDNCAFGPGALVGLTSGDGNFGAGNLAGSSITDGDYNNIIGFLAGTSVVSGNYNNIFGAAAGDLLTGTGNNIFGGDAGDALTTGSYNLILGHAVDAQNNTGDNQLTIQNAILGLGNAGTNKDLSDGIIAFYSTAGIGSWQRALFIGNNVTQGTAITDGIVIYSKNSSDGTVNATLSLYLEQAVEAIGTFTPSHKLKIWINGTEYWIQLDAV
jgi:hypothetical protein